MPAPLKRLLVVAACVFAAWYAHKPLLGAGFLGSDASVLEDVGAAFADDGAAAPWSVGALEHRPVASLSLFFSRSLHATGGIYTPGDAGRLRLEGLLILVMAAFGIRAAAIRALRPWTGEDHARAAGAAAGAFLMIHPLIVPVVGHLTARGDVVALAAGTWSVALLLRGRQERRAVAFSAAFFLAVIAAAASPSALALVPLGFGLEFIAARRHRPLGQKFRTAIQVALGYGAALGVEALVRGLVAPVAAVKVPFASSVDPETLLAGPAVGAGRAFALAAEKTGVVVLPVNTTALGMLGYVLAVGALLLALHPGFVAARAAPRLWGRVLAGWATALVVLLALGATERAAPARLADAPGTLTLAVCMAVGLGVSVTALSGARRTVLPALTGVAYAVLTASSGAMIQEAAAETGAVHEAILDARAHFEAEGHPVSAIWILDPPRLIAGVETLAPTHDSSLGSTPFLPRDARPINVRGVPAESFWVFATDPLFQTQREAGLVLLLPPEIKTDPSQGPLLIADNGEASAPADRPGRRRSRIARDVTRRGLHVDPSPGRSRAAQPAPKDGIGWVGEGSSPAGQRFDPVSLSQISATMPAAALSDAALAETPVMRYRGSSSLNIDGTERGVWRRKGASWEAVFSLSTRPAWLLGGWIKSLWFLGDLRHAAATRVLPGPADLPDSVQPRLVNEGADWSFDVTEALVAEPVLAGASGPGVVPESWLLWIVDRESGRLLQIRPTVGENGRISVPGAGVFHEAPVVWILDRQLGDVTIARARGTRESSQ